jgi:hypothetical protein
MFPPDPLDSIFLQIGGSGELLNPFRAIDPAIAIPLGLVLIFVFPGLWILHTFRIMNSRMGGDGSTLMSSRMEALFVIALIGTTFGGFREIPMMRSLLIFMAVIITVILPLVVSLLTIRQIMVGSL